MRLKYDKVVYAMSKDNPPAARAASGSIIVFETMDCFENQISSEKHLLSGIDWDHINPATGPLYVEDAMPGDLLRVEIRDIRLAPQGVMTALPGEGTLGAQLQAEHTKVIPVSGGKARFNETLEFDISPMIGVIGTAPAGGEEIPTGTPSAHGGNMDNRRIGKGAVIFLPVNVEGALLAIGDLHALMADGEVLICGLEIPGEVEVQVDVVKGASMPTPVVYSGGNIMTVASAPTLDQAAHDAANNMMRLLTDSCSFNPQEIAMLLSLKGELCICQIVDPQKTARMELPVTVLDALGCNVPR